MRPIFKIALAALAFVSVGFAPVSAGSFNDDQKKEIEGMVRGYLLEHPEILQEMSDKLQEMQRQAEADARNSMLKEAAPGIFHSATDPVAGNPKGDVTMVEFMDYNCGYCKKAVGEVAGLVDSDKNLRVVFKELPIIGGEASEYAAKAALAAVRQDKYWDLHRALYAHMGHVDKTVTLAIAKSVGIDTDKLQKDMEDPAIADMISNNMTLAQSMQLNGTPAFIVDDRVIPGYVPQSELVAAVTAVRANGGCKFC
ncbi:MAG: DsbA family protein [Hyphomicrobiales bacterium]